MTEKSSTTDVESVVGTGKQSNGSDTDVEAIQKIPTPAREPWHMTEEVHQRNQRDEEAGQRARKLGVTWQNLTAKGIGRNATFNKNVISQFYPFHRDGKSSSTKTIIEDSSGCVKPGEMLLVLGRPGSGCTTLLNVLSNNLLGYEELIGNVSFGSMTAEEAKSCRGQIIMNTEEEIFYPALTVEDTINSAARNKVPHCLPPGTTRKQHVRDNKDFLLRLAGISHTSHTKVGGSFTRGVSGGERKRVSILKCLTTRASIFCWDNSTRGLDASTALEWIKAMRVMTDVLGLSTNVTLYQAGNGIYEHFDKVLVLDEGKQIYYGPWQNAVNAWLLTSRTWVPERISSTRTPRTVVRCVNTQQALTFCVHSVSRKCHTGGGMLASSSRSWLGAMRWCT